MANTAEMSCRYGKASHTQSSGTMLAHRDLAPIAVHRRRACLQFDSHTPCFTFNSAELWQGLPV
eukprot:scaffold302221_cov21-Tisochrysis_lutea.AAC.3